METFGDDVLGSIFNWVQDPSHRKSISLVCKHWLRVEGLNRRSLRVLEPDLLFNFVPRFPNLLRFESSALMSNAHVTSVGERCPKLEVLDLSYTEPRIYVDESDDAEHFNVAVDFSDLGVLNLVKFCRNLSKVSLRRRSQVGALSVLALARFSDNLTDLDLGRCVSITDETIWALTRAKALQALNLQGCCITDKGLDALADGPLSRTLKKLVLAECDRITDYGVVRLKKMHCLEELNLAECGPRVTDVGGVAVAKSKTIKHLNLSWLINVSDCTLVALALFCQDLVKLDLTGCESVTGCGVCAFAKHRSLEMLVLAGCYNFTGNDVACIVLGCQTLGYIAMDKRMKTWIPLEVLNNILGKPCLVDWRNGSN